MFSSEKVFSKYAKRRAIIWQSSYQNREFFSYDELIKASKIVENTLREFTGDGQNNIGVLLNHSAEIVPVIFGILDSSATFCCINATQSSVKLKESIDLFRCKIGVADKSFSNKEYETLKEFIVFNKSLVVIRLSKDRIPTPTEKNSSSKTVEGEDFLSSSKPMFCCSTSGTTGKPKMVQVPFKCLMPNVLSLSNYYKITESDVIYISSPPTFDPFVVDLCLGLFNGATLLLVSNDIRLSTRLLLSSFDSNAVTIIQTTPSLFRRFPVEAIQSLLASSSLRCLILGGEPFPCMDEVAVWFTVNDEIQMRTRLFNIYGITEVSCWSSIYEVILIDVERKHLVPIGLTLDHYTTLKVLDCVNKDIIENGVGELFIESKVRHCVISENGQYCSDSDSKATGDLVEIRSGTIFYKTRVNNMVKIFGRKVNLTKIENVAKSYWPISDACCVYDRDTSSLNLFVRCASNRKCSKKEIFYDLRQRLLEQEIPNDIHFVDEFPLSCHGKISKSKLLEMVAKPLSNFHRNYFVTKLEENIANFNAETTLQLPFLAAGGTSVLALQLINELESKFNLIDPELITMLLHPDVSMEQVLSHLQEHRFNNSSTKSIDAVPAASFIWCHDLKKCIDATPSICTIENNKSIVSVGSHSHILVNVDLASGELLSKLTLPHRIECEVLQFENLGVVGCYDGFVYCFDLRSGQMQWKYNSQGMVKSKPCLVRGTGGNLVIFGNYNSESNLWCLQAGDGRLMWNAKIGDKSIYAGIVETTDMKLFVASLDGICALIEPYAGTSIWTTKLQSPIFSTAIILGNYICVAEVLGIVHCIDLKFGKILCSFKTGGNIYSSIESIGENSICFGCYDKCVYGISLEPDASRFNLLWKLETSGQIFSSPRSFKFGSTNVVVACSTNGIVYFLNSDGEIIKQLRIDGEIFSTPAVVGNRIIIASRNDFLYCYDLGEILPKS